MLKFFEKILGFIFCKRCFLCHNSDDDSILCPSCFEKLEYNRIGTFFNDNTNITFYAAGLYDNDLKKMVRGLKFHNIKDLAQPLAQFMYNYWQKSGIKHENIRVIAVPQYEKTRKPYNHAQEIAKEFAKLAGYECDFTLIKRIKKTKPQYKLTKEQREENLKNAFKLTKPIEENVIYLIIDDIITTSATINQMQKTLNTDKNIVFCATMSKAYK